MKEQISKIVKTLLEIRKENNLKVEDTDLMEFSVRIFNSQSIEKGKDKRTEIIKKDKETKAKESATEKQRKELKRLGIKFGGDITKQEAYQLIKEKKENY